MQWIPADISVDFMGKSRTAATMSVILVSLSIVSLLIFGLNLGIDFKGGSAVIVMFKSDASATRSEIENSVAELVRAETGDISENNAMARLSRNDRSDHFGSMSLRNEGKKFGVRRGSS